MEATTPLESRVRIDIRWRDLDMLGHLNQAVYHEFLEEGRAALFQQFAPFGDSPFVLARVELDYRSEVRRDHGHVDVVARIVARRARRASPSRTRSSARRHGRRRGQLGARRVGPGGAPLARDRRRAARRAPGGRRRRR